MDYFNVQLDIFGQAADFIRGPWGFLTLAGTVVIVVIGYVVVKAKRELDIEKGTHTYDAMKTGDEWSYPIETMVEVTVNGPLSCPTSSSLNSDMFKKAGVTNIRDIDPSVFRAVATGRADLGRSTHGKGSIRRFTDQQDSDFL